MSTVIGTSCPVCGYMELPPAGLKLISCERRPEWSFYLFVCPTCGDEIRKPADAETVMLLRSGGVIAQHWIVQEYEGPVITYDDVLDFALSLESPLFTIALQPELAERGS